MPSYAHCLEHIFSVRWLDYFLMSRLLLIRVAFEFSSLEWFIDSVSERYMQLAQNTNIDTN